MPFTKLPPLEQKDIHIGCACCSTACQIAHMDMLIAVGFGSANVTKDGECIFDEQTEMYAAEREGREARIWEVQDAENAALKDPDHDWQIMKVGPMHSETFQRQDIGRWVCVYSDQGFACWRNQSPAHAVGRERRGARIMSIPKAKLPDLEVGSYWMKGSAAVLITAAEKNQTRGMIYSVEYVQTPTSASIISGGASCWWERGDFSPITDPLLLSAAKGHAAMCDINRLDQELQAARMNYTTWCRIVGVMLDAARASGGEGKAT